ncbi:oxidoreductase [Levilactobacillus bambusae]|uniref:Short-chain dehydrogenase/reductase n=1 Tax=Levilactobacillus bambusae TaxID=2024736 RepID=A0A2V1MYC5_9LACO|nr:oxidoreductase [Levilactobacillus bambusae]PWF99772.1 short-chain dehydrogenase/reductase [Levilactobacillus bambusae]
MAQRKVALVTGASSGIGYAIAKGLHRNGFTVYAAARHVDRMNRLDDIGINTLYLDVTNQESAEAAVKTITDREGRLDVLVNNAGYGQMGAVEDVSLADGQKQFDTNLFAVARMIKLVLPIMRSQNSGRIINMSSVAGRVPAPMSAWYVSSKYALEGMSDTLRQELEPFGIPVILIEPGFIKSSWSQIATDSLRATSGNGPYADMAQRAAAFFGAAEDFASQPRVIARLVDMAAVARRPKTRYHAGYGSNLVTLRKFIPDKVLDKLTKEAVDLAQKAAEDGATVGEVNVAADHD